MSELKEFTGKDIDTAITDACEHYGVDREKLEIEIVSPGSSGVFGLLAKKAVVRARLLEAVNFFKESGQVAGKKRKPEGKKIQPVEATVASMGAFARGVLPDDAALHKAAEEVMVKILAPIAPSCNTQISVDEGRIKIRLQDEVNSGLLIGREGQTMAALQYIVSRILARKFKAPVRVHIDASNYRDRQDSSLRKLALQLAEKALEQGKTQCTRPLSSYHRRLIHVALQGNEDIYTRSSGDGSLKRVLISPKSRGRHTGSG